jgi:hypothetical protein
LRACDWSHLLRLMTSCTAVRQVLVAIEAAPINPSDIGPLFAPSHGAA